MKRFSTIVMGLMLGATALQAQWIQTSGPEGGYIATIAAGEEGVVAIAWPGIVYRFDEASDSWRKSGRLNSFHMEAAGDVFIASTTEGMMRSDDLGVTWQAVDAPEGAMIQEGRGGIFYAVNGTSLLRSTDAGNSWNEFGQGWDTVGGQQFEMQTLSTSGDTIIVVGDNDAKGVIRSFDGGSTWQIAGNGLPAGATIARATIVGTTLAAQVYDPTSRYSHGIYLSTDMGDSWTESNEGRFSDEGGYRHVFLFFAEGTSIGIATIEGTFRLEEGRWVGTSDKLITGIVTDRSGHIFRSDFTGISRSEDGETWARIDRGLLSQNVLAITESGKAIVASAGNGLYRSIDKGVTWTHTDDIRGEQFAHAGTDVLLARGTRWTDQGIRRSTDGGRTWEHANMGLEHSMRGITSIAASPELAWLTVTEPTPIDSAGSIFAGGIYRSSDHGATWSLQSEGLPQRNDTTLGFLAIAAEGRTAVAAGADSVYRTTDGGMTWQATGFDIRPHRTVRHILAHDGRYYLSISNTIWVTENVGDTWTMVGSFLPSEALSLSIYRGAPTIVLGSENMTVGIYRLEENRWVAMQVNLPENTPVRQMIEIDGTTYLATVTSSVLRLADGSAGVDDPAATLPLAWSSLPLRDQATLNITLTKGAPTTIELVDMSGRPVLHIDAGMLGAGTHTIPVSVSALAAGVYAYRICVGSLTSHGTVVVSE